MRRVSTADLAKLYSGVGIDVSADLGDAPFLSLDRCVDCDCQYFFPMQPGSPGFYEQLLQQPWYYPSEKSEFAFAKGFIRSSDSVLEIGCGRGAFAELIDCEEYTGLEYTEASVHSARQRGLQVHQESIEAYAARAGKQHEVVCFFQVLEHVVDPGSFLRSSIECLKPGGLLILSVPNADSFLKYCVNNMLNMPPHHVTWWSEKALSGIAETFGLSIVASQKETLADEHLISYLQTLALLGLSQSYAKAPPLADFSFAYRLKIRAAMWLAKLVAPVLADRTLRPIGHSITFVYRKTQ